MALLPTISTLNNHVFMSGNELKGWFLVWRAKSGSSGGLGQRGLRSREERHHVREGILRDSFLEVPMLEDFGIINNAYNF